MIWLVLNPLPLSPVTCLSFFVFLCVACRPGGGGAKSYNNEKACSSITIQFSIFLYLSYNVYCYLQYIMMVLSSWNVLSDVRHLHEVTSILLLLELDIVFYLSSLYSLSLSISTTVLYMVSDEQVCAHGCNFAAGYSSLNISRAPDCMPGV
jgi:hypothetical protein